MTDKETIKSLQEEITALKAKLELPIYDSFLTISVQLKNWNTQLKGSEIDLFNADSKPIFEMAYKYFVEMKPLIELQEYLQSKLCEEDITKGKEAVSALEKALQKRGAFKE